MTEAELVRWVLMRGGDRWGGVVADRVVCSRDLRRILHGRTLLATVLFAAAGAYFGFAFDRRMSRIWLLIELLQCIAFGMLGLYGWRGSAKWLALGWALHPLWDFLLHYLGPGRALRRGPTRSACLSFDWIVAAYIFIYYRVASRRVLSPER